MKSNTVKSVIVLFAFTLLYLISYVALANSGGQLMSVRSLLAGMVFSPDTFAYRLAKELISCAIPLLTILIICKGKNVPECWGIRRGFLKGLALGFFCCLPMIITNLIFGGFVFNWKTLLFNAVLPGLFEEVLFRGFLFGLLHRYCNWGFVWAALSTAVVFTIGHFYQAHDFASGLMVFGVTALGSLFFSWLYTEWDFSLWVPIVFHILMNGVWSIIPIEGSSTAVGNIASNAGRAVTVIIAIILTILYKKHQGKKAFDYKIL